MYCVFLIVFILIFLVSVEIIQQQFLLQSGYFFHLHIKTFADKAIENFDNTQKVYKSMRKA